MREMMLIKYKVKLAQLEKVLDVESEPSKRSDLLASRQNLKEQIQALTPSIQDQESFHIEYSNGNTQQTTHQVHTVDKKNSELVQDEAYTEEEKVPSAWQEDHIRNSPRSSNSGNSYGKHEEGGFQQEEEAGAFLRKASRAPVPSEVASIAYPESEIPLASTLGFQSSQPSESEFSNRFITSSDEQKVCEAFFESEGRWYAGIIGHVDEMEQRAEIAWIGYTHRDIVPAKYVKVLKPLKPQELEEGFFCECIFSEEGSWYPCVIESITDAGYQVKFKKYANRETVPIQYLRMTPEYAKINKNRKCEEMGTFKTPEYLKVLPSDSDAQKKSKKKKIKALKANFKQKMYEKESKDRQECWLTFNTRAGKKVDSIFKSPDTIEGKVGVTGSGKGMTGYMIRSKHKDAPEEKDTTDKMQPPAKRVKRFE